MTPTPRAGWPCRSHFPAATRANARCIATWKPHAGGSRCAAPARSSPQDHWRATSLCMCAIMHVSVRDRVNSIQNGMLERWGLPISQSAMLLTLFGGSVAPAFGLFPLGHLTSPHEMRAVLHFNSYCGHLIGVRCDGYFPETVADAWRILFMADAARSYDWARAAPNSSSPSSRPSRPRRRTRRLASARRISLPHPGRLSRPVYAAVEPSSLPTTVRAAWNHAVDPAVSAHRGAGARPSGLGPS